MQGATPETYRGETGKGRAHGGCQPPESGRGRRKTTVTPEDMQEPPGTGMQGHRGHAEIVCQQHAQYPAGAWLGPGTTW